MKTLFQNRLRKKTSVVKMKSVIAGYLLPARLEEYPLDHKYLLVDGALLHQRVEYLLRHKDSERQTVGARWLMFLEECTAEKKVRVGNIERYRMRVSEVKELFPNGRRLPIQSFMIPDMRERAGSIA